jgi:hypothetical protein
MNAYLIHAMPSPNKRNGFAARYFNATLDHFSYVSGPYGRTHFLQRYFLCGQHWKNTPGQAPGPIFFYTGNEADVTLYAPLFPSNSATPNCTTYVTISRLSK